MYNKSIASTHKKHILVFSLLDMRVNALTRAVSGSEEAQNNFDNKRPPLARAIANRRSFLEEREVSHDVPLLRRGNPCGRVLHHWRIRIRRHFFPLRVLDEAEGRSR